MRWGLVFLASPLPMDDAQREDLVRLAARAWFEDLHEVAFDWPGLRGTVRAAGEAAILGSFVGQRFDAEVHTHQGESAILRFLVAEALLQATHQPVAEA